MGLIECLNKSNLFFNCFAIQFPEFIYLVLIGIKIVWFFCVFRAEEVLNKLIFLSCLFKLIKEKVFSFKSIKNLIQFKSTE